MSAFGTYFFGFLVVIVGVSIGAYLVGVPPIWIAVGATILLGLGIVMATSRTKPRDPPAT
jgi:ABC-type Mn2+/Zn2+ transport system permease subunit